jgi:hypothetical protein
MKIKKVFIKTAICLFLFSIFVDTDFTWNFAFVSKKHW